MVTTSLPSLKRMTTVPIVGVANEGCIWRGPWGYLNIGSFPSLRSERNAIVCLSDKLGTSPMVHKIFIENCNGKGELSPLSERQIHLECGECAD